MISNQIDKTMSLLFVVYSCYCCCC